ncbi:MAG TPA: aminotransferase class V-fold PLP-dependent enzyme [Rudaea sp.]
MAFDVAAVRRQFPALSDGAARTWLDNAAATLVPRRALDAWTQFHECQRTPAQTDVVYEDARRRVARCVGADPGDVVFCSGTTHAIHLVAAGWADANVREGDEIVVSAAEHIANFAPWHALARRRGAHVRVVAPDASGSFAPEAFHAALSPRTRLVAIAHVSNVTGTMLPIRAVIEAAHACGARVLIDGAQAVAHGPVDFAALGADFYAFCAHKAFAPRGLGVLLACRERLEEMQPVLLGANAFSQFTLDREQPAPFPGRLEGGSANIAGALALAEALEFAQALGWDAIADHERRLAAHLDAGLAAIRAVRALPSPPQSVPIRSFVAGGRSSVAIAQTLGESAIDVRAGSLSAETLLQHLGSGDAVRIAAAHYNTQDDIDRLLAALSTALSPVGG